MEPKLGHSEEEKWLKELSTTHTERFDFLMKIIRVENMLKGAKIVHVKKEDGCSR